MIHLPSRNQPPSEQDLAVSYEAICREIELRKETSRIDFYEPLDQQLSFHRSLSQFRFWSTTIKAGKTTAGAVETIWYMLGKHPFREVPTPPVQIWIVTQTREQARTMDGLVFAEFLKWAPKRELDPDNNVGKIAYTRNEIPDFVRFKNGSVARFLSQDQGRRVFQSGSKVAVWWDEDVEDKHCYFESMSRLGKYPVQMWFTATPLSMKAAWMEDEFEEKAKLDPVRYWYSTGGSYKNNIYISASARETFEKDLENDPLKEARTTGRRTPIGGLVFPKFLEQHWPAGHVLPEPPTEEYLRGCAIYRALDWAGAHGHTASLWYAIDRQGYRTIFREYQKSGQVDTHIKNVTDLSHFGITPMPIIWTVSDWPTLADTHGFNVRREFATGGSWGKSFDGRDYRIPTILAYKDVDGGLEVCRKRISEVDPEGRPIWRVSPACPVFIYQMRHYSYHEINSIHAKIEVVKRHDHLIDDWRYIEKRNPIFINPELHRKTYRPVHMTVTGIPLAYKDVDGDLED